MVELEAKVKVLEKEKAEMDREFSSLKAEKKALLSKQAKMSEKADILHEQKENFRNVAKSAVQTARTTTAEEKELATVTNEEGKIHFYDLNKHFLLCSFESLLLCFKKKLCV